MINSFQALRWVSVSVIYNMCIKSFTNIPGEASDDIDMLCSCCKNDLMLRVYIELSLLVVWRTAGQSWLIVSYQSLSHVSIGHQQILTWVKLKFPISYSTCESWSAEFHILQADSVNVINQVASQRQNVNTVQFKHLGIMRFGRGA